MSRLGGTECTTIKFANIANIHYVRDSFLALRSVCCAVDKTQYHYRLSDSKWLHHISDIISGAIYIASNLERGDPVLLHCSDGWDRTAQLAGVAQLLLDPYYRTVRGFQDLVVKDFIEFGHMFGTRATDSNDSSPIFLQFLDAGNAHFTIPIHRWTPHSLACCSVAMLATVPK